MPLRQLSRSRVRSWFVFAIVASLGAGLLAGLAYALVATVRGHGNAQPASTSATRAAAATPATAGAVDSVRSRQDALAAAPMQLLPPSAAMPQPLASRSVGSPIELPPPGSSSPLPSGFAHSPEGALAQLAVIDAAALKGLSPGVARASYVWAAEPDAVPIAEWTPMVAVRSALNAAGQPEGSAEITSSFTPLAGQIKGTVGGDFVVACVLGEWQVTYRSTTRAGAADCQRMVWRDGRWRIGAGAQPAFPPSAWPGGGDAVRVGWRPLTGWSVTDHA